MRKKFIFLRKLSKNGTDFTRISEVFRKIKLKFSIFMIHINPEKFPVDSIIRKAFLKNYNFQANFFGFFEIFYERFAVFSKILKYLLEFLAKILRNI